MADALYEETAGRCDRGSETVLRAPSTHDAVEAMTDRLCALLRDCPLPNGERFHLKLVVHEALANAAEHGNVSDPSKHVTAICRCEADQVTLIVDDEGDGFDPDSVPDPTVDENLLKESGRGVFLIRAYADECRFENDGRRVVIVKRFDTAPARP